MNSVLGDLLPDWLVNSANFYGFSLYTQNGYLALSRGAHHWQCETIDSVENFLRGYAYAGAIMEATR